MLNSLSGVPRHQGGGKVGLAEWCVLALTILFLAYFAYATPIIMVGIWHYKRHGFGDENPGEDWDPPNVSILIPVKNEEKVIGTTASPDGRWLATTTQKFLSEKQPLLLWDLAARRVAAILTTNY